MDTIKATVKRGRVELDVPADWPEGTEVAIYPRQPYEGTAEVESDEAWSNTPEAIADSLKWYDSLEPLVVTPAEEADTEAWLRKLDAHGIAQMSKRIEDVFP
jgi:hypothetical protein